MRLNARIQKLNIREAETVRRVQRASRDPLLDCAQLVERIAVESMARGGARGRVGSKGGYVRTPSAPGTPPHVQTGALRASIGSSLDGNTAIAGPTEMYGKIHEFGGRYHPKRPFMRPALLAARRRFPRKFVRLKLK